MTDESNVPEAPLLEEIKIAGRRDSDSKSVKSVSESMQIHATNKGDEAIIIEQNETLSKGVFICNELIAMGFDQKAVFALLKHIETADLQSAMDMLIKTPYGWPHTFIPDPNNNEKCEICSEKYKDHVEARIGGLKEDEHVPETHAIFRVEEQENDDNSSIPRTNVPCKICMDGIPFGQEFHLKCGHMHCQRCVRAFLEENIRNGAVMELKCPEEKCECRFTKNDIKKLCKKDEYEKYLKFRENIEVNMSKNLRWCPAPNCGRFIESKSKTHVICECGFHMCFKCGEAWHSGSSCTKNYEKLYSGWAKDKKIQKCPKCKIRIEKNEGCNHMTCTRCNYQWCWICGGKYTSGHFENVFFGCPMLQFTSSDWSLKKIALFHLLLLVVCPLLCIYWSFVLIGGWAFELVDECYSCRCMFSFLALLMVIVVAPIVAALVVVPAFFYRLYNLCYMVVRAFSN